MIHDSVIFGKNVTIGEYVIIEKDAIIGDHVTIGNHVTIKEGTIINDGVEIHDKVTLGKKPSGHNLLSQIPQKTENPLLIGENTTIGSHTIIYHGTTIMNDVYIADLASIREHVTIGEKSIIGRSATIENHTTIGIDVTIQTNAYITAHMTIEDEVFIGPSFSSSNDKYMGKGNFDLKGPTLKRGAKIGNNATLLPHITIGERAIVGAGAVVTKDIPKEITVIGNPAKPL